MRACFNMGCKTVNTAWKTGSVNSKPTKLLRTRNSVFLRCNDFCFIFSAPAPAWSRDRRRRLGMAAANMAVIQYANLHSCIFIKGLLFHRYPPPSSPYQHTTNKTVKFNTQTTLEANVAQVYCCQTPHRVVRHKRRGNSLKSKSPEWSIGIGEWAGGEVCTLEALGNRFSQGNWIFVVIIVVYA